jgi:pSer/pThr/pTyr-binding forkhead associated (FHA) protein
MDALEATQLLLEWRDRRLVMKDQAAVELGSSDSTDLTVDGRFTSRQHAFVERRNQYFILVDHSTNGTFVQTEDEQTTFIRRGEMRLWGSGWIALGQPLSDGAAIRFENI